MTEAAGAVRRGRTAAVTVGVMAVLSAGLVWLLATSDSGVDRRVDSPLVGEAAPLVSGPSLLDGVAFSIDEATGQWVVLNFFATWCVPCVEEHPELVTFAERHADADDARVVSVVFGDGPDAVRDFFARNGGDWPVLDDDRAAADYAVAGVPESYLVAPNGIVVAKILGGVTADGLDRAIDEVTAP